jgi:hypothetical protein
MTWLYLLILLFLPPIYSQNCDITPKTPTGNCNHCVDAPTVNYGTSQTPGEVMNLGNTSPTGAPSPANSNKMNLKGLYVYTYSAGCTTVTGATNSYYDGGLTCATGVSGNTPATQVPTFSPSPTTSGYVYVPTASPNVFANSGRFYPPEVGHYVFMFMCMGSGLGPNYAAFIRIYHAGTTSLGTALKDVNVAGSYVSLALHTSYTFNSVGGANDYVSMECTRCEVQAANSAGYCRFTAYRTG